MFVKPTNQVLNSCRIRFRILYYAMAILRLPSLKTPRVAHPFYSYADHGGQRIPTQLGDLGLPAGEIDRHIGWDIGSLATAQLLSQYLDATLIHQRYSRLVIDCNRTPGIASSIPEISEHTRIVRNIGVTVEEAVKLSREWDGAAFKTAEFLKGKADIQSSLNNGTSVMIEISI